MNTDIEKSQTTIAPTLSSWKEIAGYLGRGVRTVQRCQVELRLPVRRVRHAPRSPVFAYTAELDEWLRRQASGLNEAHIKRYEIDGKLKQQIRANLEGMQRLRKEIRKTSQTHKKLISELRQQRKALAGRFRQRGARSVGSVPGE